MTLAERAEAAAANATCTRCGSLMMQKRHQGALITGAFWLVGAKGTNHFNLCSGCGPAFRAFLAGS